MHEQRAASTFDRLRILTFTAWRNVWRNPVRSLLTISALAGGLVMVILYAALIGGMTEQTVRYATELSSSHLQVHRQAFIDDQDLYATMPWPWLERVESDLPGMRFAPRLYAAALASAAESSSGVLVKAIDPQREAAVTTTLAHVRSGTLDLGPAAPGARGLERYNVAVGAHLARSLNLRPGDELVLVTQAADGSIGNALYRVSAIMKPMEPAFDRMGVLMSITAYRQLMVLDDGFHELAVKIADPDELAPAQATLDDELARLQAAAPLDELGGPAVVRNWRQLSPALSDMLEMSRSLLLFVGVIVVGLASMGMLNTMLMAVHERTHEFGILLAIGMKRRWLLLMVVLESGFLALVSALAGSLAGILAAAVLARYGIDFSASMPDGYDWAGIVFEPVIRGHLEYWQVVQAAALMIVVALIAALVPSWHTTRLKPAEVMR